jgi:hypothetical protein
MKKAKKTRPVPAPGETVRTSLPDSFDGIRFEIGRLVKYIQEGHKEPAAITIAHQIVALAADTARQLGREVTDKTRDFAYLEGIHAWCRAHFEHVENPAGAELIKTPARMLRELDIPEALSKAIWEPIRDSMAATAGKDPAVLTFPKPKTTGTTASAVTLLLTLVAAVGIIPIRIRCGGTAGTIHYVWGQVFIGERWHDVDILLPHCGTHREFDTYETMEIQI